jgi:purine-binding chemotaxis protein CheW
MTHGIAESIADSGEYVTLGAGNEIFAIGIDDVREILAMRPISQVPNAPLFMLGMIDVRGHAVAMIDLRTKLGLPAVAPGEQTRILVLETSIGDNPLALGLVTDRVFEVTRLDEREIEQPPSIGIRWNSDYIDGIGRRNGQLVIILNLSRLFSSTEAALIGGEG